MDWLNYFLIGAAVYIVGYKIIIRGFYVVNQSERAVKTAFGRAKRVKGFVGPVENPTAHKLNDEEKERYNFPKVQVILPGGPYFKFPWEKVYKVSVATNTSNMAYDPESPQANKNNTVLEAVTKDQLNIELYGQIRYRVSENNIYAYLFGIKNPIAHVMGYFVSAIRVRIANFEGKKDAEGVLFDSETGEKLSPENATDLRAGGSISINDLRKNLRDINDHMDAECSVSEARYGVILEASLITGINPPQEVESALAAINTAHNQVSSDISLAQADADQKIVQSKRAVEIETLKAESETEGLHILAEELATLKKRGGADALRAYVRNAKLALLDNTKAIYKSE
ncbi:MAG: SPFH domain-containing protein [Oscillospiraceae bacterium]|jgi:regulator of protease activity HflC (stomatin/prohibitin superfamily)|nr:SPFH domain-containing protein [Oscillospiraceae bacterium]